MTVINLEEWTVGRLALELEPTFKERGTLVADVDDVGDVGRWRKAARLAGRNLGGPVRTMLSSDGSMVFAFVDRPVEPGEQAAAAQRVADWLFGPSRHLQLVKLDERKSCRRICEP
jgi:hypothetical protein